MKKILILLAFLLFVHFNLMAQAAPPSNPSTGNNGVVGGNNTGSGAPIGEGTLFFFLLSAAYAVRIRQDQRESAE